MGNEKLLSDNFSNLSTSRHWLLFGLLCRERWGIQLHFNANSNNSLNNIPRTLLFSGLIVMVTGFESKSFLGESKKCCG